MGAMPEEIEKVIGSVQQKQIEEKGSRVYYRGTLFGQEVVAVFSRWGKVAAATTATQLIVDYGVDSIVFTGIAGGISPEASVGDVVIGQRFFQHDMSGSGSSVYGIFKTKPEIDDRFDSCFVSGGELE